MNGLGDLPSYAALAKLVRMPMAKNIHAGWAWLSPYPHSTQPSYPIPTVPEPRWASLRSLARLQPWLINCREQGSGATFLQLAVTHGVDGAMLEALLAEARGPEMTRDCARLREMTRDARGAAGRGETVRDHRDCAR